MSRKRYLSTNISVDPRVRDLAAQGGEFAALLYTWMIPHADDEGCITSNADELLLQVTPGFRWRTTEDVGAAVDAMIALGLVERIAAERLRFPSRPFYKYQAYIGPTRRATKGADVDPPPSPPNGEGELAQLGADQNNAPSFRQTGANTRKAPSRTGESSSSISSSSSVSSSGLDVPPGVPPVDSAVVRQPVPKPIPRPTPVGTLLDKIKALDPNIDVYGDQGFTSRKLKENPDADLDLVAEAYVSFRHGEWQGSKMLRESGALAWVIGDLGGYVTWRKSRAHPQPAGDQSARKDMAAKFAHLGATA